MVTLLASTPACTTRHSHKRHTNLSAWNRKDRFAKQEGGESHRSSVPSATGAKCRSSYAREQIEVHDGLARPTPSAARSTPSSRTAAFLSHRTGPCTRATPVCMASLRVYKHTNSPSSPLYATQGAPSSSQPPPLSLPPIASSIQAVFARARTSSCSSPITDLYWAGPRPLGQDRGQKRHHRQPTPQTERPLLFRIH